MGEQGRRRVGCLRWLRCRGSGTVFEEFFLGENIFETPAHEGLADFVLFWVSADFGLRPGGWRGEVRLRVVWMRWRLSHLFF